MCPCATRLISAREAVTASTGEGEKRARQGSFSAQGPESACLVCRGGGASVWYPYQPVLARVSCFESLSQCLVTLSAAEQPHEASLVPAAAHACAAHEADVVRRLVLIGGGSCQRGSGDSRVLCGSDAAAAPRTRHRRGAAMCRAVAARTRRDARRVRGVTVCVSAARWTRRSTGGRWPSSPPSRLSVRPRRGLLPSWRAPRQDQSACASHDWSIAVTYRAWCKGPDKVAGRANRRTCRDKGSANPQFGALGARVSVRQGADASGCVVCGGFRPAHLGPHGVPVSIGRRRLALVNVGRSSAGGVRQGEHDKGGQARESEAQTRLGVWRALGRTAPAQPSPHTRSCPSSA